MIPDHPEALKRLYATPIETLGLADDTLRFLRWNGITSVGHCASFYYEHTHEIGWGYPPRLIMLMHGEVAAAMQGEERDLFQMRLIDLGLSEQSLKIDGDYNVSTLGEWMSRSVIATFSTHNLGSSR